MCVCMSMELEFETLNPKTPSLQDGTFYLAGGTRN